MFSLFNKGLAVIFSITSIVLVMVFYFSVKIYSEMNTEIALTEEQSIVFSRGSSIRTLANQLIEKGFLQEKNYFLIWGKLNRQETRLQAGEYLIIFMKPFPT